MFVGIGEAHPLPPVRVIDVRSGGTDDLEEFRRKDIIVWRSCDGYDYWSRCQVCTFLVFTREEPCLRARISRPVLNGFGHEPQRKKVDHVFIYINASFSFPSSVTPHFEQLRCQLRRRYHLYDTWSISFPMLSRASTRNTSRQTSSFPRSINHSTEETLHGSCCLTAMLSLLPQSLLPLQTS